MWGGCPRSTGRRFSSEIYFEESLLHLLPAVVDLRLSASELCCHPGLLAGSRQGRSRYSLVAR